MVMHSLLLVITKHTIMQNLRYIHMKNLFYYIRFNEIFAQYLCILCIILLLYYLYLRNSKTYEMFTLLQKLILGILSLSISILMIIVSIAFIGALGVILFVTACIGFVLISIMYAFKVRKLSKISSTMERINQKYVSPIYEFDRSLDLSISENLDIHNKINDISDQYLNLIRYLTDTDVEKQTGEEYDQIMEELHKIEKMYSDIYTYVNKDRKSI